MTFITESFFSKDLIFGEALKKKLDEYLDIYKLSVLEFLIFFIKTFVLAYIGAIIFTILNIIFISILYVITFNNLLFSDDFIQIESYISTSLLFIPIINSTIIFSILISIHENIKLPNTLKKGFKFSIKNYFKILIFSILTLFLQIFVLTPIILNLISSLEPFLIAIFGQNFKLDTQTFYSFFEAISKNPTFPGYQEHNFLAYLKSRVNASLFIVYIFLFPIFPLVYNLFYFNLLADEKSKIIEKNKPKNA